MAESKAVDVNTIPYDAPLSFEEPSREWKASKGRGQLSRRHITLPDADLTGKEVIVTGGNSGIGREAALQFARWGANVTIACREKSPAHEPKPEAVVEELLKAAKEAGHLDAMMSFEHVNYANLETVRDFGKRWLATGKSIDILCNNIGIGSSPGAGKVDKTPDGFEVFHQINFLSHVLLTLTVLPALAKAEAPRILCTVSSMHYSGEFDVRNFNGELHRPGRDGVQFYANNKLWFQTWLTELQDRLLRHEQYRHITINGVHPGFVFSEIWNLNFGTWSRPFKVGFYKTLAYFMAIDSQQGSVCITHAAVSDVAGPDPKTQGVGKEGGKGGGRYFNRDEEAEPMPHTRDLDCRQRVWRKVNEELKLQEAGLLDVLGLEYVESVR